MSYDYLSKLHFIVKVKSDEYFCLESDLIQVPQVDGMLWQLLASRDQSDSYLYCRVYATNQIAAKSEWVHIDVNIKAIPFFCHEFFRLNDNTVVTEIASFMNGTKPAFNFRKALEENDFLIEIDARVMIRSRHDYASISRVLSDISAPGLVDFTIQIGDATWIAHKCVMSARSPVFRRMLASKEYSDESKQSLMTIAGISKEIFELFIRFLYKNRLPNLSLGQAAEVLIVADKYEVQVLKNICDDMIVNQLKEDDPVHDVFQFAHVYNCSQKLKEKAFHLVKSTVLYAKPLSDEFVEKPGMVKTLVEMMIAFDATLRSMEDALTSSKLDE